MLPLTLMATIPIPRRRITATISTALDVPERLLQLPLITTAELAWHIMPALGVSKAKNKPKTMQTKLNNLEIQNKNENKIKINVYICT